VRALVDEGVDHVFTVPGGMNDPFMPAIAETDGLRAIVAAHAVVYWDHSGRGAAW
jgi:thiamine pyrophosphate-dependent acetolactate synthase large subunit-like protein